MASELSHGAEGRSAQGCMLGLAELLSRSGVREGHGVAVLGQQLLEVSELGESCASEVRHLR